MPCLEAVALILLILLVPDPPRGATETQREGAAGGFRSSWCEDVRYLGRKPVTLPCDRNMDRKGGRWRSHSLAAAAALPVSGPGTQGLTVRLFKKEFSSLARFSGLRGGCRVFVTHLSEPRGVRHPLCQPRWGGRQESPAGPRPRIHCSAGQGQDPILLLRRGPGWEDPGEDGAGRDSFLQNAMLDGALRMGDRVLQRGAREEAACTSQGVQVGASEPSGRLELWETGVLLWRLSLPVCKELVANAAYGLLKVNETHDGRLLECPGAGRADRPLQPRPPDVHRGTLSVLQLEFRVVDPRRDRHGLCGRSPGLLGPQVSAGGARGPRAAASLHAGPLQQP
ncbi:Protein spinster-like protein 3 [Plecturocebus cupreus]